MQLDEYQQRASETAVYTERIKNLLEPIYHHDPARCANIAMLLRLNYVANGLAGEAGEFANKVKKLLRDGDGFLSGEDQDALSKELGGTLWYLSQAVKEIGLSLEAVARVNLGTLASRAERGKIGGSGDDR